MLSARLAASQLDLSARRMPSLFPVRATFWILIALLSLAAAEPALAQTTDRAAQRPAGGEAKAGPQYKDPERLAGEIAAFAAADEKDPPRPGAVLAVGSSSFRMWTSMADDLAPLTITRRGFGSSTFHDVDHYFEILIARHAPRAILLYEGENDLGFGFSAEHVLARFHALVRRVHSAQPECRFYVVALKPSPIRAGIWPEIARANLLLADACQRDRRLTYIDIATPMLDKNGHARTELFLKDGLHMNQQGYDLWLQAIRPVLLQGELRFEKQP
jgi:lysophospholipase L1-like esterase